MALVESQEQYWKALLGFLKTEVTLGLTFAQQAEHYRRTGRQEKFEECKHSTQTSLKSIDRFKEKLPIPAKQEIEDLAYDLRKIASTL